jgi:archaellum component FlaC
MTIDERLDRLAERHEALTQSVELLTRDLSELQSVVKNLGGFTKDIAEGTARLLNIAQIHEQRISRLEGGEL